MRFHRYRPLSVGSKVSQTDNGRRNNTEIQSIPQPVKSKDWKVRLLMSSIK